MEKEKTKVIKRINKKIVHNDGSIDSFDKQLIQLMSGVFDTRFPLVISENTMSLNYISGISKDLPLLINPSTVIKLKDKHDLGYEFVSEIENKLINSVLAFDSLTQSTSKVILLNEYEEDTGDPMISICRYDKDMGIGTTFVNEITSIYDKESFRNLLIRSYQENKTFSKNKKTEQYFIPNWLQLPEDMIYALSNSYDRQTFTKSQVDQDLLYKDAIEYYSKIDPENQSSINKDNTEKFKDEFIYCYKNDLTLEDFEEWTNYEEENDIRISYDEYREISLQEDDELEM